MLLKTALFSIGQKYNNCDDLNLTLWIVMIVFMYHVGTFLSFPCWVDILPNHIKKRKCLTTN